MKKFKKLIPALCMLLVSAVLVGTSTYAWFSMNDNVTVTGLQVTAKTDQHYLIISETANSVDALHALTAKDSKTVDFNVSGDAAKVAPCVPATTVVDATSAATVGNWGYAVSDDPADVNAGAATTALTKFDGYVIQKTVYMTLVENSVDVNGLTATVEIKNTATGVITAAKVLLAVSTGTGSTATAVTNGAYKFGTTDTDAVDLKTGVISASTLVKVDVYIYLDGTDSSIYTNNMTKLDTAKITLTFNTKTA